MPKEKKKSSNTRKSLKNITKQQKITSNHTIHHIIKKINATSTQWWEPQEKGNPREFEAARARLQINDHRKNKN